LTIEEETAKKATTSNPDRADMLHMLQQRHTLPLSMDMLADALTPEF